MKFEILQENIKELLDKRNSVLVLSVVMAVSNVILASAYVLKRERVILVPPQIQKSFWVEEGRVSKEYLEEMALYLSQLLLDTSPSSCGYKREIILRYATPESYSALKKRLLKEEATYKELQLSTHFKPLEVKVSPDSLKVDLMGYLTSFVTGQKVREGQEKLTFQFVLRGGKLMLESLTGGPHHEI